MILRTDAHCRDDDVECDWRNNTKRLSAVMLILASQRIESVIGNWMGRDVVEQEPAPTKRGAAPTIIEW